jgi:hypothetical protein
MMREGLKRKIKILNERIWENRATWPEVENWLSNFKGETTDASEERLCLLYLLRCLFRDLYRYPVIESIRRANNDSFDETLISRLLVKELRKTRFLGIGNPSESGTHLLYYFRQENGLPRDLFINAHEVFGLDLAGRVSLRNPAVTRYVFLDDFAGSGDQAQDYSDDIVRKLKLIEPKATVSYYVLIATAEALDSIRRGTLFDDVNCIFDLDSSFLCFNDESRYFGVHKEITKDAVRDICMHYGSKLLPADPFGYANGQLLLGFHHNTPDNTLPVIWYDEKLPSWTPIFKRYQKLTW